MARTIITSRQALNNLQNRFQRSAEFDNAYWTKDTVVNPTITANQTANPVDGTLTADLFTEGTGTGNHRIYGGLATLVPGKDYCYSIYVKDVDRNYFVLTEDSASGFAGVLDLQAGSVTASFFDPAKYLNVSFDKQAVLGQAGWYRFWAVFSVKSQVNVFLAYALGGSSLVSGLVHAGSSKSAYIFGAQLVEANWPGIYTPTTNSTVTSAIRNIVTSRASVSNRALIL